MTMILMEYMKRFYTSVEIKNTTIQNHYYDKKDPKKPCASRSRLFKT